MKILLTNDDGFDAKGIITLARIMKPYGDLTVVAPKVPQSGMSMAVNLSGSPIAVKRLSSRPGEEWWYLDGSPSSCVKFGLDNILFPEVPDVVVSGINHGANYGTAACYSGTIGAAQEGALAGIPSIAVSLDRMEDPDFAAVEELFPPLFEAILANLPYSFGVLYNINFPDLPAKEIKGVRTAEQGVLRWGDEFQPFDPARYHRPAPIPEEGEKQYVMSGTLVNVRPDHSLSDYNLVKAGYIAVTPLNLLAMDRAESERLRSLPFDKSFI